MGDGSPGSMTMGASLVKTSNNFSVGTSDTGTFPSASGHIVTVQNGVVLNIMPPAGSIALNNNWLGNITNQINNISQNVSQFSITPSPCSLIQDLVNEVMAEIQKQISAIEANIALLLSQIVLPSANLGSIISWITKFTAPYLAAYTNYATQLAQLVSAITSFTSAITTAAARLINCHINISAPVVTPHVNIHELRKTGDAPFNEEP